jgi:glycosyltransferase involved in cell wall biosynthesis
MQGGSDVFRENGILRIAVDARPVNGTHLRGMGKYVREVVSRGAKRGQSRWLLLANRPDLPLHRPDGDGLEWNVYRRRGDRFRRWEQLSLPRGAARWRADVLHCTANCLPWWQPVPTVVTLHDTILWDSQEEGPPDAFFLGRLLPSAYRRCAAIITISESSRRDIINRWPIFQGKLHVIPHGISDRYIEDSIIPRSGSLAEIGIHRPYLLYVGGSNPRKRLNWAIQVLASLADPRVSLVACGVEKATQEKTRETISEELRPRILFAPFIAEELMPSLYQNAVAVLYPTLYEGFGFPALEAQAVGSPVLFSALGSLAELQGPGAIVLPPHDLGAWVNVCERLVAERGQGAIPDQRSRDWARGFSWDVCAARHLEVYRMVAADRGRGSGAANH